MTGRGATGNKIGETAMVQMKPYTGTLPGDVVNICIENLDSDFEEIKNTARQKAREIYADPMLLSWYRGDIGSGYPAFECGGRDRPAWILFAQSRNGDLCINVNSGQYIFMFLRVPDLNKPAR